MTLLFALCGWAFALYFFIGWRRADNLADRALRGWGASEAEWKRAWRVLVEGDS